LALQDPFISNLSQILVYKSKKTVILEIAMSSEGSEKLPKKVTYYLSVLFSFPLLFFGVPHLANCIFFLFNY